MGDPLVDELVKLMPVESDGGMFRLIVCRWCGCWLEYTDDATKKPAEFHKPDCFAFLYLNRPGGSGTAPPDVKVEPKCPRCDSAMVERTNRARGTKFLGCSKFPACRGTRELDGTDTSSRRPMQPRDEELMEDALDFDAFWADPEHR